MDARRKGKLTKDDDGGGKNRFRNATDSQRTYREVEYLRQVGAGKGHDNVIRLLQIFPAENNKDLYLTFDYMETDLHAVIRAGILESVHKQFIIYQLLQALKYLHSGDLVHRDVKPSNLLLNADCQVKLCDFGLCRSLREAEVTSPCLTDYVATRWYRAPEILLGSTKYDLSVDIYSIGCILGEMLLGKPLFSGTSTMNQVERVLEVTGMPTAEDIAAIQSPFAAQMLESLAKPAVKSLETLLPNADKDAIDLIQRCLRFNPSKRPTIDELLKHPYVAKFHKPEDIVLAPAVFTIECSDNVKYTADDYRKFIYTVVKKNKQERAASRKSGLNKQASAQNTTKAAVPTSPGQTKADSNAAATVNPAPQEGIQATSAQQAVST